ncbi:MAG: guanylate kinase [Gemmataceae bacterium]
MTKGPLIILSGPGGVGKSTLIRQALTRGELPLRLSVSVTTRAQRKGEQDGVDYYFWNRDRFVEELKRGAFLEHAEVVGNYYGTLAAEVEPHRLKGTGVLLDIDVQGLRQVREKCLDAVAVFVRASSPQAYEERLRKRGTETETAIQRRLELAKEEVSHADEYDHQLINDDLETALASFLEILHRVFERTKHA